jgi:hypothetical protein
MRLAFQQAHEYQCGSANTVVDVGEIRNQEFVMAEFVPTIHDFLRGTQLF